MLENATNKVSKPYSLDPVVIAWVTQRAARLTIEGAGRRISDSEVANDILTAAMEHDIREETNKRNLLEATLKRSKAVKA